MNAANGEVAKEKKSSTFEKRQRRSCEDRKSDEPPKTDISSEEEDDEDFETLLPKKVQTRTIENAQIYHKFLAALAI